MLARQLKRASVRSRLKQAAVVVRAESANDWPRLTLKCPSAKSTTKRLGADARIAHHGPASSDAAVRDRIYVCSRHGAPKQWGLAMGRRPYTDISSLVREGWQACGLEHNFAAQAGNGHPPRSMRYAGSPMLLLEVSVAALQNQSAHRFNFPGLLQQRMVRAPSNQGSHRGCDRLLSPLEAAESQGIFWQFQERSSPRRPILSAGDPAQFRFDHR